MRIIEFPYSLHLGRKVPIIPVYIKVVSDFQKVWAYIDSGATYSIFEENEVQKLQIDIHSGKKTMVMVGDGGFIPVYLHKLPFKIGKFEIETTVGFSSHLGIGFNLFGPERYI